MDYDDVLFTQQIEVSSFFQKTEGKMKTILKLPSRAFDNLSNEIIIL